jgi:hypothetical protein
VPFCIVPPSIVQLAAVWPLKQMRTAFPNLPKGIPALLLGEKGNMERVRATSVQMLRSPQWRR